MKEQMQATGLFTVYDHKLLPREVSEILRISGPDNLPPYYFTEVCKNNNIVMATQKLAMVSAVFTQIETLVITSQTDTPSDNETSYSGVIYTSIGSDEAMRSGIQNPYQVGWNISSNSANGTWGSLITLNGSGDMINRALSGITKTAGESKLVIFTGSVT